MKMTDAERMILCNQNTILGALQFLCSDVTGEPFRFITEAKIETLKFLHDNREEDEIK